MTKIAMSYDNGLEIAYLENPSEVQVTNVFNTLSQDNPTLILHSDGRHLTVSISSISDRYVVNLHDSKQVNTVYAIDTKLLGEEAEKIISYDTLELDTHYTQAKYTLQKPLVKRLILYFWEYGDVLPEIEMDDLL